MAKNTRQEEQSEDCKIDLKKSAQCRHRIDNIQYIVENISQVCYSITQKNKTISSRNMSGNVSCVWQCLYSISTSKNFDLVYFLFWGLKILIRTLNFEVLQILTKRLNYLILSTGMKFCKYVKYKTAIMVCRHHNISNRKYLIIFYPRVLNCFIYFVP